MKYLIYNIFQHQYLNISDIIIIDHLIKSKYFNKFLINFNYFIYL